MITFLVALLTVLLNLKLIVTQEYVEVEVINEEIAYFTYHKTNEEGIIYISTPSRVSLTNLQSQQLILVSDEVSNNEKQRLVIIDSDVFIQYQLKRGLQDYYIPTFLRNGLTYTRLNESSLSFLQTLPSYYHFNKLKSAYQRLLSNIAAQSIIKSALILGQSLNYTGMENPLLMPLYIIAHTLNDKIEVTKSCSGANNYKVTEEDEDSCFDECPPCPEQECLSLCGYGCNCWKWICGDCCYHLGCHGHDICCREKFIQTKCLFPINFRCDSEYEC